MKIKRLKDLPFINKLRYVIVGTTLTALLVFAAAIIIYEIVTFRTSTVAKLTTAANIIGTSVTPALIFDDPIYGEEVLLVLASEQYIESALIFRPGGNVFAAYHRDPLQKNTPLPAYQTEGYSFSGDHLFLFYRIDFDGEILGTVFIKYELQEMQARFIQYAATIFVVLLAAFFISFFISARMQRVIAEPILHLAGVASRVTREKDYSVRAASSDADDEVGRLVTDFNKMLDRIEIRDKDLENLVAERTKKLWEAVRELRKLDEMKTDFFTTISHELRTPLTSVLGFAKIIQKRLEERIVPRLEKPDEYVQKSIRHIRQDLAIILSEGKRLTSMINNVLDLAKLEEGAVAWKLEPLVAAEVIERAATAIRPLLREKDLALFMDVADGFPTVIGDKDRLTQVMINLLANAVKFTKEGSVTCRLRRSNHELVISVIDTGRGIAGGDYEKLFDKFQQKADVDVDAQNKGTGLGLAICKYIVEHHKGRIWVESEVGRGSTFSFTLPLE
jgi:signal transduction histidine kinase